MQWDLGAIAVDLNVSNIMRSNPSRDDVIGFQHRERADIVVLEEITPERLNALEKKVERITIPVGENRSEPEPNG